MKIRWSPQAADELADEHFEGPEQRLRTGERVRSWPVPPFRIYYLRREQLLVLRIYDQRREPIVER